MKNGTLISVALIIATFVLSYGFSVKKTNEGILNSNVEALMASEEYWLTSCYVVSRIPTFLELNFFCNADTSEDSKYSCIKSMNYSTGRTDRCVLDKHSR